MNHAGISPLQLLAVPANILRFKFPRGPDTAGRRAGFSTVQIKRLEIVGFKSFVDKTVLEFQEGTTAVVGPNGCGKSNIVDAIRWTMGEQSAKSLRGSAMEDIIFAGSETRKPVGMAEVSLIFNNEGGSATPIFGDRSEIMVTRRLFRSGESEYLLNQTPCRLLDITELFMDTGVGTRTYSIVEQGKIGLILNAKPEDRRYLIEEAAGVTKFKARKKSALRKIDATRQNLVRLGDIIAEIKRQMNSLKRQAQKAERFKKHRDELKGIETRLAFDRYQELGRNISSGDDREKERRQLLAGIDAELNAGQLKLENLRLGRATREKEVSGRQEELYRLTGQIQKLEGEMELARREVDNLGRQQETLVIEKEEAVRNQSNLARDAETTRLEIARMGDELQRKRIEVDNDQNRLTELVSAERELAVRLEDSRKDLLVLLTDLSQLVSREGEMDRLDRSLQERTDRNHKEATGLKQRLEETQQRTTAGERALAGIRERRSGLQKSHQDLAAQVEKFRRQLAEKEEQLLSRREVANRLRSRLDSLQQLEKNLEGYGAGVQLILKEPEFQNRLGGVMADALEVPVRYEAAVEAVLSERLQAILAPRREDAQAAGTFLGRREARCSFLLPGFYPEIAPVPDAIPMIDLIQVRADAAKAVRGLLQGVYLVANLDPYFSGPLPPGVTLVTEEGNVLTFRGEMVAGGKQALDHGLLSKKREIKDLKRQVKAADQTVEELQMLREKNRLVLTEAEKEVRELEIAMHQKELKLVDLEKDLERIAGEGDRLQDRLEVLSLEEEQLHEEQENLKRQRLATVEGKSRQERDRGGKEQKVANLQAEANALQGQTAGFRDRVMAGKVAVASLKEKEAAARHRLEQLEQRRKEQGARIDLLQRRWEEAGENRQLHHGREAELKIQREELLTQLEGFKQRFETARSLFDEENRHIDVQEKSLQAIRTRLDQTRQLLNEQQLKNRELQMEAGHLRQAMEEKYRVDLEKFRPDEPEEIDVDRLAHRRDQLQRLIGEIGEVNLTAIEEFRDLEERYQFLTTQQEDLEQSLRSLQTAITKINRTTRSRFREAFDMINQKFQEVFPRLFHGGRGELRLTDEQDLLEAGIDIIVQPPGKKLQNVTLLSGGEKALAAVALIFAIFLCKPSPFCILDEVDAPLDDVNIGRFNDMVRQMTDQSQFILITHNKRTMEIADTLYGVTMEEPGVSKMVSVRLNQY